MTGNKRKIKEMNGKSREQGNLQGKCAQHISKILETKGTRKGPEMNAEITHEKDMNANHSPSETFGGELILRKKHTKLTSKFHKYLTQTPPNNCLFKVGALVSGPTSNDTLIHLPIPF
jgi:hypothetical protein